MKTEQAARGEPRPSLPLDPDMPILHVAAARMARGRLSPVGQGGLLPRLWPLLDPLTVDLPARGALARSRLIRVVPRAAEATVWADAVVVLIWRSRSRLHHSDGDAGLRPDSTLGLRALKSRLVR